MIASVLIWLWMLQPSIGVVNYLLSLIGVPGPPWVQSTTWAVPSLVILSLWNTAGGSRMIVFLAGLQGVPQELYEASHIDGANRWQRFINVTVPMISPTIFFNLVISVIGALSVFSVAYIGTQGGPAYATYFYVYHLYISAFQFNLMGYASAMAWIFLLIVLALTWLQFWGSEALGVLRRRRARLGRQEWLIRPRRLPRVAPVTGTSNSAMRFRDGVIVLRRWLAS